MDLCVSATGMKGWVGGLVFVLIGDCCLDCVVGDDCGVSWDCVCECMCSRLWRHNRLWWCMLRWCAGNAG